MTHSYLLVTSQGSIQRIDSDGAITVTDIQSHLSGEFDTAEWEALNVTLTCCFNRNGAQSGLATNVKFKAKCGNVLIGIVERGTFRGLTDDECRAVVNFISTAL